MATNFQGSTQSLNYQAAKGLKRIAELERPGDPLGFLQDVLRGKWEATAKGFVVTSHTENGVTTQCAVGEGMQPNELVAMAETAIQILEGKASQKRIRYRFRRA